MRRPLLILVLVAWALGSPGLPAAWCQAPPQQPEMAIEEAIQALQAPLAETRDAAAIVLSEAGPKASPAVPVIIDILNREWPEVRGDLLFVLLAIGPDAQEAVPVLMKVAGSTDFHARYLTARVLGAIGPPARPAVPLLINMLNDQVASVRRRAAEALGNLGPDVAPDAIRPLIHLIQDGAHAVRVEAILAVGKFGELGKAALPRLQQMATAPESSERAQAARAIWMLTQDANFVLPILIQSLNDGGLEWEPLEVIAEIGPAAQGAVPHLVRALDKDESVQIFAATALGKIGPGAASAVPALRTLLDHPEQEVRDAAQQAIAAIERPAPAQPQETLQPQEKPQPEETPQPEEP